MIFQNLTIQRTIIHEVFKRTDGPTPPEPRYATAVVELGTEARDALQQRITAALGHASHGVEMRIRRTGDESVWARAQQILDPANNETSFVTASQAITAGLASAQTNRIIPGGVVVVVQGTAG